MIKTKVLIAAMLAAQLVSSAACAAETGGVGISADIKSDMCLISDRRKQAYRLFARNGKY